ncbi:MAG: hydroxyacid dehydrogenase [Chloroflexi bacterium]|nr:hydroxyacid dehydrogenase [Chloroflexota bacterium]
MTIHAHFLYEPAEFFHVFTGEEKAQMEGLLDPAVQVTWGQEAPETAVILIGGRPSREQLRGPNVRVLIVPWAGLPTQTADLLAEFPHVAVHNLHHNAAPVAETAVTLLLAAAKLTIPYDQALRRNNWELRYGERRAALLAGKTALILGYGAIGARVARICQAMEMRVLATKRTPPTIQPPEATIYPSANLPHLLPQADALIICLPLTTETKGLIGAAELALLPPGAILVNIGRGPIVDEAALYEGLRNGRLYAAGLDVWYNYPPDETSRAQTAPANFPFHELDNVVLSPHRGGLTLDTERLRLAHLAELLNQAARGEAMGNRVDLGRGY